MNINQLEIDKKTERRIRILRQKGYPNPVEKAQFEKLSLNDLQKVLYIANKIKKRRELNQNANIKSNPISIKNFRDSYKFANQIVETALKEQAIGTGLIGEGILIATYSQLPIEKLNIQILELNKEIKKKKEIMRIKLNAGNVDKLVDIAMPNPFKK